MTAEAPGRAGFVSFVGRPNVGKSTLLNALVGEQVAITSAKPQTTRRLIRGIVDRPGGQLVVVDTPGLHRPRTLLGQRLNELVEAQLAEVDVIAFCVPADERIGPGDRRIAERVVASAVEAGAKAAAIVTKLDAVPRERVLEQLAAVGRLRDWDLVVPVSAVADVQLDVLADELLALMPVSPPLYPPGALTDESVPDRIAEIVREAVLEGVREELPHSVAVTIDEIVPREPEGGAGDADRGRGGVTEVYAKLWVERDSQKAIVIGRGGARLREIGTAARAKIEPILGGKVYLSIQVKVAKEWQRDPKQLGRLGF